MEGFDQVNTEEKRPDTDARDYNHYCYDLVQKVVHAIVWEADATMRQFSFVSNRTEEILGYPAERWLREPDFWSKVVVHPEDREWVTALYQKAALAGTKVRVEYRALAADGRVVWFRDNICVTRNADGHAQQLGGAMLDITDRKVAEELLGESEKRYRRLVELCPDPICIHSGGKVLYVNPAAVRVIGAASPDDLIGRSILDFIHPDYIEIVMERLRKAHQREGEPIDRIEEKFIRLDGQAIDLEVVTVGITYQGKPAIQAFFHDVTERNRAEAQRLYLADHDPLTGLFNRRHFQEELSRQINLALRYSLRGAVFFLDLDNFKNINDTLGHKAGDELLKALAGRLQERLRETDILARIGGDEFAVILPQADAAQAEAVAGQILQVVGHPDMIIEGQPVSVTASIGIALFPEHGKMADELLTRADLAMYHAKEQGRNRTCIYSSDQDRHSKMLSSLNWLAHIRKALEQDHFVLYLQPVLNLQCNTISQYEVLLRMVGDKGELIMPGAFLDYAERFGLIHDIDRWVVCRAIRLIAEHQQAGRDLCLQVNLSGKAFTDPELLPLINQELASASINPSKLLFEITETAAIENVSEAGHFIAALKTLGCSFGLDDFGVGFSSLNYLKNLPLDYLKIDGSFIHDLCTNSVDQCLVKAIVEVAHGLGKLAFAECIESEATLQLLQEYGVDFAQGYHIGRPRAAHEILGM